MSSCQCSRSTLPDLSLHHRREAPMQHLRPKRRKTLLLKRRHPPQEPPWRLLLRRGGKFELTWMTKRSLSKHRRENSVENFRVTIHSVMLWSIWIHDRAYVWLIITCMHTSMSRYSNYTYIHRKYGWCIDLLTVSYPTHAIIWYCLSLEFHSGWRGRKVWWRAKERPCTRGPASSESDH